MAEKTNLWKHRFFKLFHLINVYWRFFLAYLQLRWLKIKYKKKLVGIILTQHFGDIVAAEPIARQARERYPDALIVWMIRPIFRELLEGNPNVNYILEEFCANERRLLIRSSIFDELYNLQLHRNSTCPICNVFVENKNESITPENYYNFGNLLSIQQLVVDLPVKDYKPQVFIAEQQRVKIDSLHLPQNFIVIHAQSVEPYRNWAPEKWRDLVDNLTKLYPNLWVIEIGLKSDLPIQNSHFINLCGKLSLLETAEVIRRAKVYVGIDSGPAHFANAVGTYGVLLLGKWKNFTNHQPYSGDYLSGKNATILRTEEATAAIPLEQVQTAVLKAIQHINF